MKTNRTLRLTAKRQATLPAALCEQLGVGPGDTLTLERREIDGEQAWLLTFDRRQARLEGSELLR